MSESKHTSGFVGLGAETDKHICINGDGPRRLMHVFNPTPIPSHTHEMAREEMRANAALVLEAFNVANETGLTPGQLAEQREELLATCEKVLSDLHAYATGDAVLYDGTYAKGLLRAAIAKARETP